MKVGYRKPNIKKSIKARTTGKIKRKIKKSVNPLYGKKGMGLINNPKKAIYNKVYNKTTFSIANITSTSVNSKNTNANYTPGQIPLGNVYYSISQVKTFRFLLNILGFALTIVSLFIMPVGIITMILGLFSLFTAHAYKKLIHTYTVNTTDI